MSSPSTAKPYIHTDFSSHIKLRDKEFLNSFEKKIFGIKILKQKKPIITIRNTKNVQFKTIRNTKNVQFKTLGIN